MRDKSFDIDSIYRYRAAVVVRVRIYENNSLYFRSSCIRDLIARSLFIEGIAAQRRSSNWSPTLTTHLFPC